MDHHTHHHPPTSDPGQAPHRHDHGACVKDALARAEAVCAKRGARLTAQRARVLELVWSSHKPRGAYAILEDLSKDGKRVAPLTVYRALDFLLEQGLIHRIESQNAFVGCPDPGTAHTGQFLVCKTCGDAIEMVDPRIAQAIAETAAAQGFTVTRQTVEVTGICPACRTA